ncbi:MAG: hypothetical protein LHV69_09115 [Elusimicrobia bacterium]|nr:hypothetical protein [Candidatus Obscuribacterium magneticum]
MRKIASFACAFFVYFLSPSFSSALDPYPVIEALLPSENHPRVLNSDDLSQLNLWTPTPLFSPTGDFDKDGDNEDLAISGIFDLMPKGEKKYFLLVATKLHNPTEFKELFFQQYDKPVFIHLPGTTGPEDPKTQGFSTSFCINCSEGLDFFWDKKTSTFIRKPWKERRKLIETVKEGEPEIPPAEIDEALKIVGQLKDVNEYIVQLKKKNGMLHVKVERPPKSKWPYQYIVKIGEKKGEDISIYDRILVDTGKQKVIKRNFKL